ncbi:DUF4375 domain-containing protein [Halomonas sp. KG2]|uniref:DMP19 family protein n=1 Tax=Halomonas sp. KG2 TaxID=2951138 RepID=UPI0026489417|nr:DUF4375 domain-containing protein [Halomonas sp. KG2]WKD26751.1 DUF4375 domain-containing protein [Halomonas sp. KG2]
MHKVEKEIKAIFGRADLGIWAEGQVKCDMSGGSVGYTGSIKSGLLKKTKSDITETLNRLDLEYGEDFGSKLFELREESKRESYGPIYRCNINVKGKNIGFEYFWEGAPFQSLSEVEPGINGSLPNFIYERMFTKELIAHVNKWELDTAIFMFVPAQKQRNEVIPEDLLDMYALVDWQADTDNGGLNQYFAREIDYFGCFDREELYPRVLRAIKKVNHQIGENLFSEAMALFSHFYERVDRAREAMDIVAVEKQEESDINDRYFKMYDDLELKRCDFVKQHSELFAVSN